MAQFIGLLVIVGLVLAFCGGESTEDAYERGYDDGFHDGWVDTCNDIARFSTSIEETLEGQRIC